MKIKSFKMWVLFFFLLYSKGTLFAHAYYVSITEININEENSSIEISLKVYIDDFELMLEKNGQEKLFLGDSIEKENADEILYKYIKEHLNIYPNQVEEKYKILGKETVNDAVYIFLEIPIIEKVESIKVQNSI